MNVIQGRRLKIGIVAALISIIIGIILQFLFNWTGKNNFVALFSSTNESTWEHLKLLFFPYTATMIVEYFLYGKDVERFFIFKLLGVSVGLFSIVSLFYTYTGIIGMSIEAVNIAIYVISVILAYAIAHLLCEKSRATEKSHIIEGLAIISFAIIMISFFIFTFYPPKIPLFRDPQTMSYGIS